MSEIISHSGRGKPRSRAGNAGPFARDSTLSTIDRRTRAGRVLRSVEADLVEHLGGNPTTAERLIIQSAALKATRLSLLTEKLLDKGDLSEGSDHHALAWLNSLRLDLAALGLERRAKDVTPDLKDYIAGKAGAVTA
jgi:hypothetical protein